MFLYINISRKLLGFGTVSWFLGYNAMTDFFPSMMIKPNPNCDDNFCIKQQEEFKNRVKEEPITKNDLPEDKVTHEDNTWGLYFFYHIITN